MMRSHRWGSRMSWKQRPVWCSGVADVAMVAGVAVMVVWCSEVADVAMVAGVA